MNKNYGPNNENLPEELQSALRDIARQLEDEDSWVRKQQVKIWKKCEEFWEGIQYIFWSESRQDWISPTETRWFQQEEGREEAEGPFYDFVINIFRAHGEAIIAALSAQLPAVRFPPDDAESEEDLIASKTYAKIADLIQRHNNAKVLILKALFTLCTQGIVAAYHAPKSDKAFGTVNIPNYEKDPLTGEPQVTGYTSKAKSRTIIEIYGGLHVKVPYYAQEQKECGYLSLKVDFPTAYLKSIFPHVADKIENDLTDIGQYERGARTPSAFSSWSRVDENKNLRPLNRLWIRPWEYELLGEKREDEKNKLKELFPEGCYVAFVGPTYVESRPEKLDKYWTIGKCGLSRHIHSNPYLQPLLTVQELTNVVLNLTVETMEQAIPSTFADQDTLNFKAYSRHEARPGMVYPIKVRPGENAGNKFFEQGRATLSKEIAAFQEALKEMGQFVVGSFPSVFGGPSQGKSRTASEYNMSRQMALQRLGIFWALLSDWWCKTIEKCVKLFIDTMIEDERYTLPSNTGYINVWIRRSELVGKVGEVESEGSDTFPVSTPQKQELLMRLLGMNSDFLNAAIFDPENRHLVADTLSYPDMHIPGENQRTKQLLEIQMILKGQPIAIEPVVDDDAIHAATTRNWLVEDEGLDCKIRNPQGYMMIVQHLLAHEQALAEKTMQQFGGSPPGQPPQHNEEISQ